jgi:hypothetical protein
MPGCSLLLPDTNPLKIKTSASSRGTARDCAYNARSLPLVPELAARDPESLWLATATNLRALPVLDFP